MHQRRFSMSRTVAAGMAAAVLAASTIGLAAAQATPTPPPDRGRHAEQHDKFLDALAKRLGVTVDGLRQAIQDARQDAGLRAGPSGERPGRPGERTKMAIGHVLEVAANAIGISPADLRQELPGKSLTDVARAHNANPTTVADAIKAAVAERIDQMVTASHLNADRAAELKKRVGERVDTLMTRTFPQRGPKHSA